MSEPQPKWQWDSTRNLRYYYSHAENAYCFENGARLPLGGSSATSQAQNTSAGSTGGSASPRNSKKVDPNLLGQAAGPQESEDDDEEEEEEDEEEEEEEEEEEGEDVSQSTLQYPATGYTVGQSSLTGPMAGLSIGNTGYTASQVTQPNVVGPSYSAQEHQQAQVAAVAQQILANTVDKTGNQEVPEEHDEALEKYSVQRRGRIRGVTGNTATQLFPGYYVRTPSHRFFKRGRVIKVLWPELYGTSTQSDATADNVFYGEGIYTKIRWFIIVREGYHHCNCLPINTYGKQGVSKSRIIKHQHAIAYSTKEEPEAQPSESPGRNEYPMMPGIRIVPRQKPEKLDKWARIDFSRVYTVEHNVKVYDFGKVHEDSMARLDYQWRHVIGVPAQPGAAAHPLAGVAETTHESSEEEDDDEEEEVAVAPKKSSKEGKKAAKPKSSSKSQSSRGRRDDKDDKKPRRKKGFFT